MRRLTAILGHPAVYVPVAGGLLWIALRQIDAATLQGALDPSSVWWLLAAVAVNLTALPVWAFRTLRLLAGVGHDVPLSSMLLLSSFVNVANQILPAATGELGRGAFLAKLHSVPGTTVAAVLAFERLFGFGLMTATAGATLIGFAVGPGPALGALALSLVLAALVLVAARSAGQRAGSDDGGVGRRTLRQLGVIASKPRTVAEFFGLSMTVYVILAVGFILSSRAVGLDLGFLSSWAVHGGGMVVGTISALPFGLGAADLAISAIGGVVGESSGGAALAAVAMRLALTVPLGIVGAVSYGVLSRRLGRLSAVLSSPTG